MRRVLGIDPGSYLVGYSVIDVPKAKTVEYIECGVLQARKARPLNERIFELVGDLREVLEEFKPTEVAIEGAFSGRNVHAGLVLAEARGAFKLVAADRGLPVSEYAPASIKRIVAGNGRATKADVQRRVRMLCQLNAEPTSDAADAIAIALCHIQSR